MGAGKLAALLKPLPCNRNMESELAGSVTVKLVPALLIALVTEEILVGKANELVALAFPESCTTVAAGVMVATPFTLNVADIVLLLKVDSNT